MAQITKEKIICPACGREQEVTIYRSITASDEVEKMKIITNRMFEVTCEACEEKIPLLYNCLYHDTEQEAMYWLLPAMTENELQEMNQLLQTIGSAHANVADQNHYRYRKVLTTNELREKILIAEQNLDDRIIELLKVVYLVHLSEKIGDKVVSEIMFDVIDDVYYIEIFYEDVSISPGVIIPDMEIYKQLKEQYLPYIEATMSDGFVQIDFDWARNILFSAK